MLTNIICIITLMLMALMASIDESNANNAKVDLTVDVNGKRVIDVSHPEKSGGDVPTLRGTIMIMYLPKNCKLYFLMIPKIWY